MDRLTCPLIEFGCRRERRAWWDVQAGECGIVTAVRTLKDIRKALFPAENPAIDEK
jgi:hypothetical protein